MKYHYEPVYVEWRYVYGRWVSETGEIRDTHPMVPLEPDLKTRQSVDA